MPPEDHKITLRQLWFMFILLLGSPSVAFLPNIAAMIGKQASWMVPICVALLFLVMLLMLERLFRNYHEQSILQVMEAVLGKVTGKALTAVLIIIVTLANAASLRYYALRITSSVSPDISSIVFEVILVLVVAYIMHLGLPTIARTAQVLFHVVLVMYLFVIFIDFSKIDLTNFYPISTLDIMPLGKASLSIVGMWARFIFLLMFFDQVKFTEHRKKVSLYMLSVLTILSVMVIVITVGIFGSSLVANLPLPFFSSIKIAEAFKALEGFQAFVVFVWIFTDYMLIIAYTYAAMSGIKSLFNLPDTNRFINLYMTIVLLLCIMLFKNLFEFHKFVVALLYPTFTVIGFGLPLLLLIVGKIRKKV